MLQVNLSQKFVSVTGADSARYLRGLLSCEINDMQDLTIRSYLLLTPQGKLISFGQILKKSKDAFVLSVPVDTFEQTKELLLRYIIADQVEVCESTDFRTACLQLPEAGLFVPQKQSSIPVSFQDGVFDFLCGIEGVRICWLQESILTTESSSAMVLSWRTKAGLPMWGYDFGAESAAIELPLEFAVSFKKGCYMGQEVVAKGTIRGKPPRYLVKVTSAEGFPEKELKNTLGQSVGEIRSQFENYALALVRRPVLEANEKLFCGNKYVKTEILTHWSVSGASHRVSIV